ncbi:MAG TPA: VanZ family protein [Patescibacteria group bacterium]|jgi:VanZ family protein|nr:VanZ family protein [Patescibacteria group bacterium]
MIDANMNPAMEKGRQRMAGRPMNVMTRPIPFHPWYGLATMLYMVGISLLSSTPRHPSPRHTLLEYGLNLSHLPMFAGLAFLMIKTIAPKQRQLLATRVCAVAALLLVTFAALDEWHQAFVPGRSASVIDLFLDVMGIGAVLLFYRLSALVSEES